MCCLGRPARVGAPQVVYRRKKLCWQGLWRLLKFSCCSWASSSAGRAPRSQRGGRGFESPLVHQHLLQAQQLTQPCEIRSVGRVGHFSDFCVLEAKIPCLLSLPILISIRAASEAFCKPRTRHAKTAKRIWRRWLIGSSQ